MLFLKGLENGTISPLSGPQQKRGNSAASKRAPSPYNSRWSDGPGSQTNVKEALAETFQEQRELLHEVMTEVLEDFALAEAISPGSKKTMPDEVFRLLRGKK